MRIAIEALYDCPSGNPTHPQNMPCGTPHALRIARLEGDGATSSYSQAESLSGFGTFNASLSDSTEQGRFHPESSAVQTSAFTPQEISLESSVWASEWLTNHNYPFGNSGAVAFAHSTFEMTFKVLEPLNYELDATRSVFHPHSPIRSAVRRV